MSIPLFGGYIDFVLFRLKQTYYHPSGLTSRCTSPTPQKMDPLKVGGALVVDSMSTQIPTSEVYLVIPSFRVTDSISEYLSSEKPKNGGEKPSTAQT